VPGRTEINLFLRPMPTITKNDTCEPNTGEKA
jgi:hypothetical protein